MADLIQFDDASGARIGRAVRFVEEQVPRTNPLTFGRVVDELSRSRGLVRLCKTTVDWEVNTRSTLNVWESGESPAETQSTGEQLEAVNKTKKKVREGVFVIVAKGKTGEWYLVEEGADLCPNSSYKADTLSLNADEESGDDDIAEGNGLQVLVNASMCAKWLKLSEITYITNVTLGETGLEFETKKAWAFESVNEADPVTIQATDCT